MVDSRPFVSDDLTSLFLSTYKSSIIIPIFSILPLAVQLCYVQKAMLKIPFMSLPLSIVEFSSLLSLFVMMFVGLLKEGCELV